MRVIPPEGVLHMFLGLEFTGIEHPTNLLIKWKAL